MLLSSSAENPAHMRPPLTLARSVRIFAHHLGMLVVNSVGYDPIDCSAFKREHPADGQEIFEPLRRFVAAMRQQAMVAHTHSDPTGYPSKTQSYRQCRP